MGLIIYYRFDAFWVYPRSGRGPLAFMRLCAMPYYCLIKPLFQLVRFLPDRHIVLSNYNTIITISIKMLLKLNPPGLCAHVYGGLHKPQSNVYARDFGSSHQYITFIQKISSSCKAYFFHLNVFWIRLFFFQSMKIIFRFAHYDMRAHCINVSSIQVLTNFSSPDLSASIIFTINIFIYLYLYLCFPDVSNGISIYICIISICMSISIYLYTYIYIYLLLVLFLWESYCIFWYWMWF